MAILWDLTLLVNNVCCIQALFYWHWPGAFLPQYYLSRLWASVSSPLKSLPLTLDCLHNSQGQPTLNNNLITINSVIKTNVINSVNSNLIGVIKTTYKFTIIYFGLYCQFFPNFHIFITTFFFFSMTYVYLAWSKSFTFWK